jgi:hypothetical protein
VRNRDRAGAEAAYLAVPACRRSCRATLMRTSIVTFDTRARQRFFSVAQQAMLHARDGDASMVERVLEAVEAGHIAVRDGHAALASLRRDQQTAA